MSIYDILSAQYVMQLSHLGATISNQVADCDLTASTSYDRANGIQQAQYVYSEFVSDPTCNSSVLPSMLGYSAYLDGPAFTFSLEIRSLMDAVAANMNILPISRLQVVVDAPTYSFIYGSKEYNGTYYVDSFYPGMTPMFCVSSNATLPTDTTVQSIRKVNQLCMLIQGSVVGLPTFMHYGAGGSAPGLVAPMPCLWCVCVIHMI